MKEQSNERKKESTIRWKAKRNQPALNSSATLCHEALEAIEREAAEEMPQVKQPTREEIAAGKYAVMVERFLCCSIQSMPDTPRGAPCPDSIQTFMRLIPAEVYRAESDPQKQFGEHTLLGFDWAAYQEASEKIELEGALRENGLID